MRIFIALTALALAACAPPQQPQSTQTSQAPAAAIAPAQTAQARCTEERAGAVTFTNTERADTVSARADGPTCAHAVLTLVLRDAGGAPLWVIAGPYQGIATLGDPEHANDPISPESVRQFLDGWIQPTRRTTQTAPEWPEGLAALEDAEGDGVTYSTPYTRDTYVAFRQRNLPMLCFTNSWEGAECVIVDPISRATTVFVRFGS